MPLPRTFVLTSLLLCVTLAGCPSGPEESDDPTPVKVYCAGGIRLPIQGVAADLGAERADLKIELDYAGSGELLGRIKSLPPDRRPDVYVAGDDIFGQMAVDQGLADRVETLAYFLPAIAVASDNPKGIDELSDLAGEGVRVALGEARVTAVGRVTDKLLAARGLEAVRERQAFTGNTVQELANQLLLGHVDAAILWDATARQGDYAGKFRLIPIPDAPAVRVVICRVLPAHRPAEADAFIAAATGEKAKAYFEKYGFTVNLRENQQSGNQ